MTQDHLHAVVVKHFTMLEHLGHSFVHVQSSMLQFSGLEIRSMALLSHKKIRRNLVSRPVSHQFHNRNLLGVAPLVAKRLIRPSFVEPTVPRHVPIDESQCMLVRQISACFDLCAREGVAMQDFILASQLWHLCTHDVKDMLPNQTLIQKT